MIGWINVILMVITSFIVLATYVKSVGPKQLENKIGEKAYKICGRYRVICGLFMFINMVQYVVYYYYPINIGIPHSFYWDWWFSAVIAIGIAIPSGYIMFRGAIDAGEESIFPKKEHTMYGGIYNKIRHPQAMGELWFWFVFAFLLHSPFLVLFSIIWIPIFVYMCIAEEKDLVLRYGKDYVDYRDNTGFIIPKFKH